MTREEQDLRAQIHRLIKVYPSVDPSVQRGMISQIEELYQQVHRMQTVDIAGMAPRFVVHGGEIFDQDNQKFVEPGDVDPETILPSEY